MSGFKPGQSVRINTPGESHHKRTGTIMQVPLPDAANRYTVDLGDVKWAYFSDELLDDSHKD